MYAEARRGEQWGDYGEEAGEGWGQYLEERQYPEYPEYQQLYDTEPLLSTAEPLQRGDVDRQFTTLG